MLRLTGIFRQRNQRAKLFQNDDCPKSIIAWVEVFCKGANLLHIRTSYTCNRAIWRQLLSLVSLFQLSLLVFQTLWGGLLSGVVSPDSVQAVDLQNVFKAPNLHQCRLVGTQNWLQLELSMAFRLDIDILQCTFGYSGKCRC